jgi:hypothetical protein
VHPQLLEFFSDIDARPRRPPGPTTQRHRGTPNNGEESLASEKAFSAYSVMRSSKEILAGSREVVVKRGDWNFENVELGVGIPPLSG